MPASIPPSSTVSTPLTRARRPTGNQPRTRLWWLKRRRSLTSSLCATWHAERTAQWVRDVRWLGSGGSANDCEAWAPAETARERYARAHSFGSLPPRNKQKAHTATDGRARSYRNEAVLARRFKRCIHFDKLRCTSTPVGKIIRNTDSQKKQNFSRNADAHAGIDERTMESSPRQAWTAV